LIPTQHIHLPNALGHQTGLNIPGILAPTTVRAMERIILCSTINTDQIIAL
jgi:hypothetical protein